MRENREMKRERSEEMQSVAEEKRVDGTPIVAIFYNRNIRVPAG